MHVLAIDTATAATAVAVVRFTADGRPHPLAQRRHVDPRAHGERLAPLIRQVLGQAGARPEEMAAVVVGDGPGPFTGLRVGLATAAAMAQALGVPAYGACSLDGLGAATAGVGGPVLVATDARRREIYWARYEDGQRVTDPAVDRPADVVGALAGQGVRIGYGEGALRYRDVLGVPVAEDPVYPDPVVLAAVAYDRVAAGAPGEALVPRYLRRADAAVPGKSKPVTR